MGKKVIDSVGYEFPALCQENPNRPRILIHFVSDPQISKCGEGRSRLPDPSGCQVSTLWTRKGTEASCLHYDWQSYTRKFLVLAISNPA